MLSIFSPCTFHLPPFTYSSIQSLLHQVSLSHVHFVRLSVPSFSSLNPFFIRSHVLTSMHSVFMNLILLCRNPFFIRSHFLTSPGKEETPSLTIRSQSLLHQALLLRWTMYCGPLTLETSPSLIKQ
jgi:hypothetical protein